MALFDRFRADIRWLRQRDKPSGLIGYLSSGDPSTCAGAARDLCAIGSPALPDLLTALGNASVKNQIRIIKGLTSAGASSIPLIISLLLQADSDLQTSIADAVAEGDDEIFKALSSALHHQDPKIRHVAAISFRKMGRKAIPPLSRALKDSSHSVRREAADTLSKLQWAPDDLQEKIAFYYLLGNWTELIKLQGSAVPLLIKILTNKDARIRSESARALGKIHDDRALPALIKALKDPQEEVRIRVVEALGEMGDDRARLALVEALNDPSHQVRMEAAWALDRLGWSPQSDLQRAEYLVAKEQWNELILMGRSAVLPLIRALEVEYSGVRVGASEALLQLGQAALDALNLELESADPARKQRARYAIEYIQRRQEEAHEARPTLNDSSRYEQELSDGLAIQRRFEEAFGRPDYGTRGINGRSSSLQEDELLTTNPDHPAPQTEEEEPEEPVDLDALVRESQKAENAWIKVKARLRSTRTTARQKVPLEQLVPIVPGITATGVDELTELRGVIEPDSALKNELLLELGAFDSMHRSPSESVDTTPRKTALERCLEALKSGDTSVKAAAIATLQDIGEIAVRPLIEALKDPDYVIRIAAADALGEIGDEGAIDPLTQLFNDDREDVRIAATSSIGRIGGQHSIKPLIKLFGDRFHGVRVAATNAVATIGRDALKPLEEALDDPMSVTRAMAAEAIGLIGATESVPILIEHLGDPAPEVRWKVARALGEFGSLAIDPLVLVLRRGGKEMRLAAIDSLWEIADRRADEALLYALKDDDEDVRAKATAALRKRQAMDVWRRALGYQAQSGDQDDKKGSAKQEGESSPEQTGQHEIDILIEALKDEDQSTRLGAATRLMTMGRPAAEGLIRALKGEDHDVKIAAASILGEMHTSAVTPLIDALDDGDRFVRLVAARNLGKIGDNRAIEALIESLHHELDDEVRTAAAKALGGMSGDRVIASLTLAMRDRDERVRITAARSLGSIDDKRAIEPLIRGLIDLDGRVRYATLEALRDSEGIAKDHLVDTLRSEDVELRTGAAEALEMTGWTPQTGEEWALYLIALDRWAEVERVGEDALPVLTEALSDPSIEIRTNAIRITSRIGGEKAIIPLIGALRDDAPVVRMRAERALIEMAGSAIPALTKEVSEASPEIRERLQWIIDEIQL